MFHIARNAGILGGNYQLDLVVCWGGHSINALEYEYTKKVGYQLGIRGLDICTGCGPGAMKGPMKGATIGHAKQRTLGRYIGISEPGIIAAESIIHFDNSGKPLFEIYNKACKGLRNEINNYHVRLNDVFFKPSIFKLIIEMSEKDDYIASLMTRLSCHSSSLDKLISEASYLKIFVALVKSLI